MTTTKHQLFMLLTDLMINATKYHFRCKKSKIYRFRKGMSAFQSQQMTTSSSPHFFAARRVKNRLLSFEIFVRPRLSYKDPPFIKFLKKHLSLSKCNCIFFPNSSRKFNVKICFVVLVYS